MGERSALRILFLAAEAEPFVKVGGLGDVAGSLPRALRALPVLSETGTEVDIRVVLPLHKQIPREQYDLKSVATFSVPYVEGPVRAEVLYLEQEDLPIYFIAASFISNDDAVYHSDTRLDGRKYTLFSLAAVEMVRSLDWKPDILHANDWHTALSVYTAGQRRLVDPFFSNLVTLLGVHNLPYLGTGAENALKDFGVSPAASSALPWWARALPLPLGLLAADAIVAPSPAYANEILTPQSGSGLEEFLYEHRSKVFGILNGIDTRKWDPKQDRWIAARFDCKRLGNRLKNKTALLQELNLEPHRQAPLLTVSGMDSPQGIDLVPAALRQVAGLPWRIIILCTDPSRLGAGVQALETEFPGRVRIMNPQDASLDHRLYAGSDLLLMPHRSEPGRLNQMIALRYGCVPVAYAAGGLHDTVVDFDRKEASTGFLFEEASAEGLASALERALSIYPNRAAWKGLQLRGMGLDISWERSARQYLNLYESLMRNRPCS